MRLIVRAHPSIDMDTDISACLLAVVSRVDALEAENNDVVDRLRLIEKAIAAPEEPVYTARQIADAYREWHACARCGPQLLHLLKHLRGKCGKGNAKRERLFFSPPFFEREEL